MARNRAAFACLALALAAVAATVPLAAAARAGPTHHRTPGHSKPPSVQQVFLAPATAKCVDDANKCLMANPADTMNPPADKVDNWAKTCEDAENFKCCACDIYRKVQGQSGAVYSGSDVNRAKIIPAQPLRGIESIASGNNEATTNYLWEKAITDLVGGKITNVSPAVKTPTKTAVAVLNAVHTRSRHQLHIHVGQATGDFYACFDPVIGKAVRSWTPVSLGSNSCQNLKADKSSSAPSFEGWAKSVPLTGDGINGAIREGLAKFNNGDVSKITSSKLMHVTAIVMPTINGYYTVMLVTNTHDHKIYPSV